MTDFAFDFEDIDIGNAVGQPMLARHYRPQTSVPYPTLVDIHGGAWSHHDRTHHERIHRRLAERGIGIFALDFRMPPEAQYPAAVADTQHGIRWLKQHADSLGVHLPWIGGFGASSGGHLIMLNALRPRDPAYASPAGIKKSSEDASLAYVVACWPVLDPWARYLMATAGKKEILLKAHKAFWPDDASMQTGNPTLIVERGDAQETPPVLIVQGTEDENAEHARADLFVHAYQRVGGSARLIKYPGQAHAFMVGGDAFTPVALEALEAIEKFVFDQTALK